MLRLVTFLSIVAFAILLTLGPASFSSWLTAESASLIFFTVAACLVVLVVSGVVVEINLKRIGMVSDEKLREEINRRFDVLCKFAKEAASEIEDCRDKSKTGAALAARKREALNQATRLLEMLNERLDNVRKLIRRGRAVDLYSAFDSLNGDYDLSYDSTKELVSSLLVSSVGGAEVESVMRNLIFEARSG